MVCPYHFYGVSNQQELAQGFVYGMVQVIKYRTQLW
jgi:hypothetical protein